MTIESELPLLDPAHLAERVADRFRASALDGSRHVLQSREVVVEDGGIPFSVRVLRSPSPKPAAASPSPVTPAAAAPPAIRARSPFLPPYEPGLLVGAISPTHVILLNKYNIVDRHVLILTRAFEEQESPLDFGDLQAAGTCLAALDGLVFFNSAPAAGASQRHKHLQLVPFPLGPGALRFPFDRPIAAALVAGDERLPALGYRHRLAPRPPRSPSQAAVGEAATRALACYRELLTALDLERPGGRLEPYNLLMTRDWMLMVPRARASCGPVEVNALGFAGALVVRGEEGLNAVREVGPLGVLRAVTTADQRLNA